MLLRGLEHSLNPLARALLAERHLQDGVVDGLARDLPPEVIQFAVRNFEARRRVFMLSIRVSSVSPATHALRNSATYLSCLVLSLSFLLDGGARRCSCTRCDCIALLFGLGLKDTEFAALCSLITRLLHILRVWLLTHLRAELLANPVDGVREVAQVVEPKHVGRCGGAQAGAGSIGKDTLDCYRHDGGRTAAETPIARRGVQTWKRLARVLEVPATALRLEKRVRSA